MHRPDAIENRLQKLDRVISGDEQFEVVVFDT
jgi:hypothetical protein